MIPDSFDFILFKADFQNSYLIAAASGVFTECDMVAISASNAFTAIIASNLLFGNLLHAKFAIK